MTARLLRASIALGTLLMVVAVVRADVTGTKDTIAKFVGTSKAQYNGQPVVIVGLELPAAGSTARVMVPNADPKPNTPAEPKAEFADAIKKLTPGTMVKVSYAMTNGVPTLVSIEPFESKPGEDTPNGYVFSKTYDKPTGKSTTTIVVLTKFGVEHTFNIATRRNDKGETEQDPDVVAALANLQEGNSVWAQIQANKIIAIEPYKNPETGKLIKTGETEIDEHKVRSADIETADGKTITVLVPGRANGKQWVADATVTAGLGKVHAGAQVQYRVREDGDKIWLREITALPATRATRKDKDAAPMKDATKDKTKDAAPVKQG